MNKLIFTFNNGINYKNIRILSELSESLYKDTMNGIQYWTAHKHRKCYKCKQYGHEAIVCDKVCKKCYNIHYPGLCGVTIATVLERMSNNISRFCQSYDVETLEKEIERLKENEKDHKKRKAAPTEKRQRLKEVEKELEKLEKQVKILEKKRADFQATTDKILKEQLIVKTAKDYSYETRFQEEKHKLELMRNREITQLEERFTQRMIRSYGQDWEDNKNTRQDLISHKQLKEKIKQKYALKIINLDKKREQEKEKKVNKIKSLKSKTPSQLKEEIKGRELEVKEVLQNASRQEIRRLNQKLQDLSVIIKNGGSFQNSLQGFMRSDSFDKLVKTRKNGVITYDLLKVYEEKEKVNKEMIKIIEESKNKKKQKEKNNTTDQVKEEENYLYDFFM